MEICKDASISCSGRAKKAEDQTRDFTERTAEVQRKLNSKPRKIYYVKLRSLIKKVTLIHGIETSGLTHLKILNSRFP